MKKTGRLIVLFYIAATLFYALFTAVRLGLLTFAGGLSEMGAAISAHQFALSDFVTVRSDAELNALYLVNLARGILVLAVVYFIGCLLQAAVRKSNQASANAAESYDAEYDYEEEEEYPDEPELPAPPVQVPAYRKEDTVKLAQLFRRGEAKPPAQVPESGIDAFFSQDAPEEEPAYDPFDSGREPQNRPAGKRRAAAAADEYADGDYFSGLSADADNVRVIVKITQRMDDGDVLVSFFCGDTVQLERCSTASRTANRSVGSGEVKRFIQDTRKTEDVFYVYDIRKAAQTPVLLTGDMEDAVRLIDRKIVLRIYRQQMLFITPQYDIRTVDSASQEPAAVWAVQGVNNSASRTRSYIKTFYHMDEGIEYEVEVRIKL